MISKGIINILEEFPDPIRIIDLNGTILYVNDLYCNLVLMKKAELIGQHFSVVFHPAVQSDVIKQLEEIFFAKQPSGKIEVKTVLWNGEKVWLDCSYSRIKNKNEEQILSVIRDYSAQKQKELQLSKNEEKYRTLFNNTIDAMFVCYLNYGKMLSNFMEINEIALRWLGYTKNEFYQLNPISVLLENSESKSLEIIDKLLTSDQMIFDSVQSAKDGSKIPVEISSHLFEFNGRQAVLFISRDITQRQKFEDKLRASSEQLRQLAIHLQSIREEERKLIAREIHDELGQVLTVLKIQLSLLPKKIEEKSKEIVDQIRSLTKLVDNTIESVQKITAKLRPDILDELGIVSAIEWQTKQFTENTGIACERLLPKDEIKIDPDRSTALFRILQESLTNVARHSNASKVNVILEKDSEQLHLEITDNGKGITNNQINNINSLGILGMKERALVFGGEFIIKSSMGSGTTVKIKFPIGKSND